MNSTRWPAISCTTQGTLCTVDKVLAVSLGLILLIDTYKVTANTGLAAFSSFIIPVKPLALCCIQHSTIVYACSWSLALVRARY